MGADGIIEKASSRFTIEDVEARRVEAVSVIAVEELESLIAQQVEERTGALQREVEGLQARLAEAEAGGGGLEAAAADAALQAEAAALEAKAAAELRAEQAESRANELQLRVKELEGKAGAGQRVAELEARVKELEAQLAQKPKPAAPPAGPRPTGRPLEKPAPEKPAADKPPAGEGQAEKPPEKPAPKPPPKPAPITEEEHGRALRTAKGLIEDVINEDEDAANAAIKAGKFRSEFEAALNRARQSYERRVKESVRKERDHWEAALKELEAGK